MWLKIDVIAVRADVTTPLELPTSHMMNMCLLCRADAMSWRLRGSKSGSRLWEGVAGLAAAERVLLRKTPRRATAQA